jgi:hypothetical protein
MGFTRAVLGAFIGSILAIAFALAYRVSRESGRSVCASLVDVPAEAQRVFGDAKTRATEMVTTGHKTVRHKQESVVEYVRVGRRKQSETG